MRGFSCFLFYCWTFLVLTSAIVISPPATTTLDANFPASPVNVNASSSIVGDVDPQFAIVAAFDGSTFPLVSLLTSTVEYLAILSLEDWSGYLRAQSWTSSSYPQVRITIVPVVGLLIQNRYVIWGLSLAANLMMNEGRYQSVKMTLL